MIYIFTILLAAFIPLSTLARNYNDWEYDRLNYEDYYHADEPAPTEAEIRKANILLRQLEIESLAAKITKLSKRIKENNYWFKSSKEKDIKIRKKKIGELAVKANEYEIKSLCKKGELLPEDANDIVKLIKGFP